MKQGKFLADVMYKMRNLKGDIKFGPCMIAALCTSYAENHNTMNDEEKEKYLVDLAAKIGNYLED